MFVCCFFMTSYVNTLIDVVVAVIAGVVFVVDVVIVDTMGFCKHHCFSLML